VEEDSDINNSIANKIAIVLLQSTFKILQRPFSFTHALLYSVFQHQVSVRYAESWSYEVFFPEWGQ